VSIVSRAKIFIVYILVVKLTATIFWRNKNTDIRRIAPYPNAEWKIVIFLPEIPLFQGGVWICL
jgi:hypothetical protein